MLYREVLYRVTVYSNGFHFQYYNPLLKFWDSILKICATYVGISLLLSVFLSTFYGQNKGLDFFKTTLGSALKSYIAYR